MYRIDSLNKYEKIYDGNFTKYGLDINLTIYGNNLMTTLNITVFGVSEIQDPYIYQIPYQFAPLVIQRCIGFAELDILVITNGLLQISCAQGQQIGSDSIYGKGEVGLTFSHR